MRPHSGIDMSFWGRICFTIESLPLHLLLLI